MEQSKIYKLLALTAIVSILISVGTFTLLKDSFIGPQGEEGVQGETGLQGIQGEVGSQGVQGIQGESGESIVGSQGSEGPQGEPGSTIICDRFRQDYTDLLNSLNMTVIEDFSQTIEFNFSAGTSKTWEFLIPEYGIVWETMLDFSGNRICTKMAWRRGEERYIVGSSGESLTYKGSEDIVYYGYQEYLWGSVTVDYYLRERDLKGVYVTCTITTNLPTISGGWGAFIDIAEESYEFVINGGLEERIEDQWWMPVGWDGGNGGGTIGSAEGYTGICVTLHSWSHKHGSTIGQTLSLNKTELVLSFWMKTVPRTGPVTLQVLFDHNIIYSETFTELRDWTPVLLGISTYEGTHLLQFFIPADVDYEPGETPYVAIDEVSLIG